MKRTIATIAVMALASIFALGLLAAEDPHLTKAKELRAQAAAAYDAGDYEGSAQLSAQARAELKLIAKKTPPAPPSPELAALPATYTVRLIPEHRDCLWRIAAYPFVYKDPLQWKVLYEANKAKLRQPENPDLINPDIVLVIPSIAGEKREGAWESGKQYEEFAGK